MTKTFTALLLAQAVHAKAVSLDTPVAQLLPDFSIPERNDKPITLGLLAEQFSGLPRMPGNWQPADLGNPYADYGRDRLKAFLADYKLPRDPGAAYEYSNLGFGLLEGTLELAVGREVDVVRDLRVEVDLRACRGHGGVTLASGRSRPCVPCRSGAARPPDPRRWGE